ncbi:phage portal protein [Salmonella enterica subsp. enterica serovar Rovaniemi]|uniref:Phage portal protein n=1 Tax=Salmonella enterica subsp. enterica serovar Agbeni TaxID=1967642 RepID=A0A5X8MT32_SALET|nr:phage portal protein [Salmonella enterica subsp. enterica serovar Agbeni]EBU7767343.1 phage portal protein [Salmonella enterica subsp. enterica serovar Rovaniemi]ECB0429285.1 phage portal protein [Salmonella enterica subsp. enterica serovar Agbeni]EHW4298441.1 phage portal protein [Salmonella enterica subsp. enterica serovar Agbeni]HCM2253989.1 phage portal protein [Salmonella enterica subsp. enterica serovar Agbeni]
MRFWPFGKREESRSMTIEEAYALLGAANTNSGEVVNPSTAESLPAVMNAVTAISEAVATMPCYLYSMKGGVKQRIDGAEVSNLVDYQPNDWQTPFQFKRSIMRQCLLTGNAYAVIEWGRNGQPKALIPVPSRSVVLRRSKARQFAYDVTWPDGTMKTYLPGEVFHMRHMSDDGWLGRSPITVCREAVGLGLAQQRHGGAMMQNGMMASGVITSPVWFDEAKGKKALENLERYKGAKNAGKTPILEGGMKFENLGMSNQDAEWIASRTFTIGDIARIFNISPIFLQDYSHSNYNNFTEATRAFLTQTLRPWLTNFEQQLKKSLFLSNAELFEFDTYDLLRANPKERYESYGVAIKSGFMNPNEARAREGMPPYAGGEEFSQAWKQVSDKNEEEKKDNGETK